MRDFIICNNSLNNLIAFLNDNRSIDNNLGVGAFLMNFLVGRRRLKCCRNRLDFSCHFHLLMCNCFLLDLFRRCCFDTGLRYINTKSATINTFDIDVVLYCVQ